MTQSIHRGVLVAVLLLIALAFGLSAVFLNEKTPVTPGATACDDSPAIDTGQMVWVEGGEFLFGSDRFYPEESEARRVDVAGFWIKSHEVTNAEFAAFVEATGYVTAAEKYLDAERFPDVPDDQRQPGSVVFVPPVSDAGRLTNWWQFIHGASWRAPDGPGSGIEGKDHHPVVHVAYEDALAYAQWKGESLPSEQQWEFAARAQQESAIFAWGDDFLVGGQHQANTWQGLFPLHNSADDGYVGRASVGCFPANAQGLYDMIGNVWEWTSNWYVPEHADRPVPEQGFDPQQPGVAVRVIKGGSYLCAANFCQRYRPAARHPQDATLGTSHIGFRTVKLPASSG